MKMIAIIPARGGSKGVPGKNLKMLNDKPLLAHSITQGLNSEFISDVYVSSDCHSILACADSYGAKSILRPSAIAGDTASSESALSHALDYLQAQGQEPDYVVFLQCTSPFRQGKDIDEAIKHMLEEQADSLLSVIPNHRFLWQKTAQGMQSINYDYRHRPRRQDMPVQYQENGSIYIFKPWVLAQCNNRLGGKISMYQMDEQSAIDIDTEMDFRIAEAICKVSAKTQ